ncbi:MAG: CvpA family protein [Alphaproteobacteria bacterium]
MPVQWLDVVLIVIMLISAFLAMLRGLTREMLSIMSLALAALAALLAWSMYHDRAAKLVGSETLGSALLVLVVFTVVLVVVSIITIRLADRVLDSRIGAIDRTLGFVFGLVRGLIIVVVAFELAVHFWQKEGMPEWVTEARSLPMIESTGDAILKLLPDNPAGWFQNKSSGLTPSNTVVFAANSARFITVRLGENGRFYTESVRLRG